MQERVLIRKVKEGDRKSFDCLCSELYPALVSYATLFLSLESAEDVVQDVFFAVWQRREELNENLSIRRYLFRSVRNAAYNCLKVRQHSEDFKEWNYNRIASLTLSAADVERNPVLQRLYDGDLRRNIIEAVRQLPPRQQEIFNLSYVEQLTSKEIGERLGISARTVENHRQEAQKTLRKLLSVETLSILCLFNDFF